MRNIFSQPSRRKWTVISPKGPLHVTVGREHIAHAIKVSRHAGVSGYECAIAQALEATYPTPGAAWYVDRSYIMQAFNDGGLRVWQLPVEAQGFIDWFDCAEHLVKPLSFVAEPDKTIAAFHGGPKNTCSFRQ